MKPPFHIQRFIARHLNSRQSVLYRHSDRVVRRFLQDPEAPILISFPRTGSHYLRLLMELHFQKPSLPRIFHYKKAQSFTCCHMHDLDPPDRIAGVKRRRVIYLYRAPGPTIHSVMRYYKENIEAPDRVDHWAAVYGAHLKKWILQREQNEERSYIHYKELRTEPDEVFKKLSAFLGEEHDPEHLHSVMEHVSKDRMGQLTRDNPSIIGDPEERNKERKDFLDRFGERIREGVLKQDDRLEAFITEDKEEAKRPSLR